MENLNDCPEELDILAQEVGKFIRYWGFKMIHGRIWTHLYLSNQPLDAGTLMKRLKVSKALMSLSLNDLLEYHVIEEAGKSARGTMTYTANARVLDVIMNVLSNRERVMLTEIDSANKRMMAQLGEGSATQIVSSQKLKALGFMVQQAQSVLNSLLKLSDMKLETLSVINDPQTIS